MKDAEQSKFKEKQNQISNKLDQFISNSNKNTDSKVKEDNEDELLQKVESFQYEDKNLNQQISPIINTRDAGSPIENFNRYITDEVELVKSNDKQLIHK